MMTYNISTHAPHEAHASTLSLSLSLSHTHCAHTHKLAYYPLNPNTQTRGRTYLRTYIHKRTVIGMPLTLHWQKRGKASCKLSGSALVLVPHRRYTRRLGLEGDAEGVKDAR